MGGTVFDPKREEILPYSYPYSTPYISRATTSASTCPPALFTRWFISFSQEEASSAPCRVVIYLLAQKVLFPAPPYFCLKESFQTYPLLLERELGREVKWTEGHHRTQRASLFCRKTMMVATVWKVYQEWSGKRS